MSLPLYEQNNQFVLEYNLCHVILLYQAELNNTASHVLPLLYTQYSASCPSPQISNYSIILKSTFTSRCTVGINWCSSTAISLAVLIAISRALTLEFQFKKIRPVKHDTQILGIQYKQYYWAQTHNSQNPQDAQVELEVDWLVRFTAD